MVDDPFGHGEAFDLRARLEERLDHHEGLRRWLAPVVGSDPEAPRLDALHQEAAWDVETRLTLDIRRFQGLYPLLVAMQRARLEAERLDAPADKWDDATIKAQRAAERLFRDLHEPYRFERPPYSQELSEIWAFSRGQIAHAAQAAGLVGKAPVGLCRVSRGQVADAESRGRGSLRSLMALAILAARWNDAHPMRRLLRDRPDVLRRLDDLATARNQAAHDGQGASAAAVPRFIDAVYDAVNLLLPLS
jgi:hypothetical protein